MDIFKIRLNKVLSKLEEIQAKCNEFVPTVLRV